MRARVWNAISHGFACQRLYWKAIAVADLNHGMIRVMKENLRQHQQLRGLLIAQPEAAGTSAEDKCCGTTAVAAHVVGCAG